MLSLKEISSTILYIREIVDRQVWDRIGLSDFIKYKEFYNICIFIRPVNYGE